MASFPLDALNLGLGVGLRSVHYPFILQNWPKVDWFEIISENYMDSQGRPRDVLNQIAERYPIVMHGVSLSIGSAEPLDFEYLRKLKKLSDEIKPHWVSDHLCWTGIANHNSHDLLPVPLTEATLKHVCERIDAVQNFMGKAFVFENPSSYLTYTHDTLSEWEFLSQMAQKTGCGLLLDVNNVYVSSVNHDFDPFVYLDNVPHDRIVQFHLAGHTNMGTYCIDTHDGPVIDPVWKLYQRAHELTGGVSTLLEWDANIPDFPTVHAEVLKAQSIINGLGWERSDSKASVHSNDNRQVVPQPAVMVSIEAE